MPVQKRYTGWYTGVKVPADLQPIIGKRELVESLRTTSAQEARLRGHHIEAGHCELFASLRRQRDKMTTDQLRALAQRYLAARLDAARTDAAINITAAPSNPIGLDVRADQLRKV